MELPWKLMFISSIAITGIFAAANVTENTGVLCGEVTCETSDYCDYDDVTNVTDYVTTPDATTQPTTTYQSVTMETNCTNTTCMTSQDNILVTSPTPIKVGDLNPSDVGLDLQNISSRSFQCRPCEDICQSYYNESEVHTEKKYSTCKKFCEDPQHFNFLSPQTKDRLGIAAVVLCASIITLFAGRLIYKRVRKKIRNRQEREDEDTLFIMQDPEWLSPMPPASDTALFSVPTASDLGDGPAVTLRRPGLSGGEYGSVTLHAADENHLKV